MQKGKINKRQSNGSQRVSRGKGMDGCVGMVGCVGCVGMYGCVPVPVGHGATIGHDWTCDRTALCVASSLPVSRYVTIFPACVACCPRARLPRLGLMVPRLPSPLHGEGCAGATEKASPPWPSTTLHF